MRKNHFYFLEKFLLLLDVNSISFFLKITKDTPLYIGVPFTDIPSILYQFFS